MLTFQQKISGLKDTFVNVSRQELFCKKAIKYRAVTWKKNFLVC